MSSKRVFAGRYYGRRTPTGPLEDAPAGVPDIVICRRVADFPNGTPPPQAATGPCPHCGALIAWNPANPHTTRPKSCMQCAHIRPDPLP